MYGTLTALVFTLGLIYIVIRTKGVIHIKITHAVEQPPVVPFVKDDDKEEQKETLDSALKAVQDSINIVNGTGGRRDEQ